MAKYWLNPLALADSGGFDRIELNRIAGAVEQHREMFLERWNEFFGR